MKSYDVFLSHDSRDKQGSDTEKGWVLKFAEDLSRARVSYFLDKEEIRYGDSISERVREALVSSRTLVVFVSNHTIDNLKREASGVSNQSLPKSWVYAELEFFLQKMATSRKGELFLYILYDLGTESERGTSSLFREFFEHFDSRWQLTPKNKRLANPLLELVDLRDKLWCPRAEESRLVGLLRSQVMLKERRQFRIDSGLQYNADRQDEQNGLGSWLSQYQDLEKKPARPLLFLLAGEEEQCHEKFLTCFRDFYLPTCRNYAPNEREDIAWPATGGTREEFENRLLEALGKAIVQDPAARRDEIHNQLATRRFVTFVRVQLCLASHRRADDALEFFFRFWSDWPNLLKKPRTLVFPVFVILEVVYPKARDGFFSRFRPLYRRRKRLFEKIEKLAAGSHTKLYTLTDIARSDLTVWAELPEVRAICGGRDITPSLDKIFEERTRLSMRVVSSLLQRILRGGES